MYLGLDIGTTSICAVVINKNGETLFSQTLPNNYEIVGKSYEKLQDPDKIFETCKALFNNACEKFPITRVGISNQMHGIIYVDKDGNAISHLITWQDGRGNLIRKQNSYAQELSLLTNYKVASGYGATTLFYDTENGNIPLNSDKICTIGDYVAMHLCNVKTPIMHESNAHSLGLYDIKNHHWDETAIEKAGLDYSLLSNVVSDILSLGKTDSGVEVFIAVGDNQASVYGVERGDDTVVINVGTGSQVSIILSEYIDAPQSCEIRPYFNGKYLMIGGALCGGYSYQLLKNFYHSAGVEFDYDKMNEMAKQAYGMSLPTFDTKFKGSRENPNETASITGLTADNFNAPAITLALLKGISEELKELYEHMLEVTTPRKMLVGSGNGIRFNPVLQKIVSEDFKLPIEVSKHLEEAAYGAALLVSKH